MERVLAPIFLIGFLAYGVVQFYAGWLGLEHYIGAFWAGVLLAAAIIFRFTLPITVGAFLGATTVWGWHWFWALIFTAPGLVFVVPGILVNIVSYARGRWAAR